MNAYERIKKSQQKREDWLLEKMREKGTIKSGYTTGDYTSDASHNAIDRLVKKGIIEWKGTGYGIK